VFTLCLFFWQICRGDNVLMRESEGRRWFEKPRGSFDDNIKRDV
jgi:hypothetical protein